jgi:hypothetical protein
MKKRTQLMTMIHSSWKSTSESLRYDWKRKIRRHEDQRHQQNDGSFVDPVHIKVSTTISLRV